VICCHTTFENNLQIRDVQPEFSLIFIQDLGNNWAEAVEQSAYYGLPTGKKAGIVLDKDFSILLRAN
jgi:hypothetical protein